MRFALSTALAALLAACSGENGPLMSAGQDCLGCHDGGAARRWTVAGTWARGAHVDIVDAHGKTVSLRGNKVGNFYTAEPLAPPLTVTVDGRTMPPSATGSPLGYGGCNLCHVNGAVVALDDMAPGRDCLRCHTGGLAKRFYAAGTWTPGSTVVVNGTKASSTNTTRPASGNFHVDVDLGAITSASVTTGGQTRTMTPVGGASSIYGGCNACHGGGGGEDGG